VLGVHQGAALDMVEEEDAREKVARGVLRGKPSTVKLMEVAGAVSILDAQRVPRDVLISALLMEVAAVAAMKGARRQHEENRAAVLSMVEERDARKRTAQRVRRASLAFALLTEVGAAANMKVARRVPRAAPTSANLMVVARDARIQIAARARREAPSFARATEEGSGVQLKDAQRVSMVAPSSVLHMAAGSAVRCQDAPRVLEDGQTAVFVMAGANGANLLGAVRARRGALSFARLMGEASVAYGANQDRASELAVLLANAFQGARMDCASRTML
jgi:hypothetical protein